MRSVAVTVMMALGLVLPVTACEYPGIAHPLAVQVNNLASTTSVLTPTPAAAHSPETGTREPGSPTGSVEIKLKDFRLDPDKVMAKAGTITFVLKNEGRYTHDFRVEGEGIDEKAPKVGQGRTFEWQVTLPIGAYRISCPISNHADRGMVGTLEVAP